MPSSVLEVALRREQGQTLPFVAEKEFKDRFELAFDKHQKILDMISNPV